MPRFLASSVFAFQKQQVRGAQKEDPMRFINSIGVTALAAALMMSIGAADAFDDSKYPDLKGQWRRFGAVPNTFRFGLAFDPSKPFRAEEPPLTPEYQAIYEANIYDMEKGGQGIDPTYNCLSPGMPRVMAAPIQQ
jgi:hypothetical protein